MARPLKLGMNTGYWAGGPPPGAAEAIAEALTGDWSDSLRSELSERSRALADRHPLYPELARAAATV